MYCISVNYRACAAAQRERYALTRQQQQDFLRQTAAQTEISACAVLMTCNRSEFYYTGSPGATGRMEELIHCCCGVPLHEIRRVAMRYVEQTAIQHLFRVACGLDSMVLGEVEIIRQIKEAYQLARQEKTTDAQLCICFEHALELAKETASCSAMTRLPVSVGTLAARAAVAFCDSIGNEREKRILLVGATGTVGGIVARDLLDLDETVVIRGTSRRHHLSPTAQPESERMQWVSYDSRYEQLDWAQVVISATGSPHYTFLAQEVQACRRSSQPLLFLDLAVPRDVDENLAAIAGCQVQNMDDIQALAQENNAKKQSQARQTERVVAERVEEVRRILRFREFVQNRADLLEELQHKSAAQLLYRCRDTLSCEAFSELLRMLEEERE